MNIKLMQLHLENFKCHKSLTLDFGGRDTTIRGDNATGKTSIYDGLTWLLFGKDSAGNGEKNIEIKPLLPDGSVADHQAVTEVEAILEADGEEIRLKRTYQEVWSTKRGSIEATYDGNTSEYYVDGVPCKANAFKSKVAELVDEETFRLLTTVSYFPGTLPWQKRREILFTLFGICDDKQILETDSRFSPLLEGMGKRSLEDYKKMLLAQKKSLQGARNEIPARISECEKTIADLGGIDFASFEAELEQLNVEKEAIQNEIIGIDRSTAAEEKRIELKDAQFALKMAEQENQQYRQQQADKIPSTTSLAARAAELNGDLFRIDGAIRNLTERIATIEERVEQYREKWKEVHAESFTNDICPNCGQKLTGSALDKAIGEFVKRKNEHLENLVRYSENEKDALRHYQAELEDAKQKKLDTETQLAAVKKQIQEATEKAAGILVTDMEGFREKRERMQANIDRLTREMQTLKDNAGAAAAQKREQLEKIKRSIFDTQAVIGKKGALEYARERIDSLREDARKAAEQLSEVEKMLFLMDEFSRYKASFVEGSINDRFQIARFRLFREQANGGIEDRCDVTVDGVPYTGLNNGMKINSGIDIINTLSRAYGVTVPLFVDNAESVTRLQECGTQVIRLVVDEDYKEVTIYG